MNNKIKIIIADDDFAVCDNLERYLKQFDDVEILGVANTDEDEIRLIENLKPEIIVSDLVRNHKYTGLEIIKKYNKKGNGPKFLVISADNQEDFIQEGVKFDGFIQKPCCNFNEIINLIRKIKENSY